ncbi:anti-phage dCTP deaminase [Pseudodesulfovibrio sp.]|uniref:anti-phage dCTP deaminase n=1 Tax=Pseudodesulfovibrio sp. TaxID=2035812 RepID=UPI002629E317|nr:anti-phage dCTP deaminase [Pseudodesulfovibrio sp.]MDD3313020.1 anti-phage dCTP deaminase [Pseudodesulfovibrio sp.]
MNNAISLNFGEDHRRKPRKPFDQFVERETEELVIAVCGAAGSGTSRIADAIEKDFRERGYDVGRVKLSETIKRHATVEIPADEAERIQTLQKEGTQLRVKFGRDVLAMLAIKGIRLNREKSNPADGSMRSPESRRFVTIIDSLKHPQEERLLRKVYGDMFYLFGVLCPEEIRIKRLQHEKSMSPATAHKITEIDKSEEDKAGQQLLDTIHLSDFFLRNTDVDSKEIRDSLIRFIDLILGANTITPTIEEYGMALAYTSSLRSGCISRQVGAAIIKDGEVISTGRNDVPKFEGGLYSANDKPDGRCFKWGTEECRNDKEKRLMKKKMADLINDRVINDKKFTEEDIDRICKTIGINNLIEYSRAIHAEMDALIGISRSGNASSKGGVLFCTTYPCHNCARHIVAAGIKRVYYIEPYEKSLATKLHDDTISTAEKPSDKAEQLEIIAFEGVGPTKYSRLFRQPDRKDRDSGKVREINTRISKPYLSHPLDRFTDYEARIVEYLTSIELDQKRLPE